MKMIRQMGMEIPSIRRGSLRIASNKLTLQRSFFKLPTPFGTFDNGLQEYQVKKVVNVSPSKMFEIVSDVSRYKEFVPFVENSYISSKDALGLPTAAGLRVGWKQFDEEFQCKLRCQRDVLVIAESMSILVFDLLYTKWNLKEVKNVGTTSSCEVTLDLKYSFKNPLYNTVSSLFSDQVSKIMINAFEERAVATKIKERLKF